jgi:hypothetical protein
LDGGITWTATFTPTASVEDATNVITLDNTGVADAAGNAGSGTTNSGNYTIDTVLPTILNVTSSTANGTYHRSDVITVTVEYSENIFVTGTPQLTLETGTIDQPVNYVSGSGTSILTFAYSVQSGDNSTDLDYISTTALSLNGGTIEDAATNNAVLTLPTVGGANSIGGQKELVIDGIASITSATYDATTGVLALTCLNIASGETIDPTKITLTGEGGSTYTLTTANVTASSTTLASITLNATDLNAVNMMFNKNGLISTSGTTYNLAAADDWDASVTIENTTDATNAVTVNNVTVPTITSATYDATSGNLIVTGMGFLSKSGALNDINISRFAFTGEDGVTRTLTSSGVEIISGTSFSVTLNSADIYSLNQVINKNGTSSVGGTVYNLAAAEDWAAGADAAIVDADLTGNGVTVSNAIEAPTTQASNLVFSSIEEYRMTIGWTNGNGSKRVVFVKQANAGTANPENNTFYTSNTSLLLGTQIGTTGWYCVYNGTGTSVTLNGLADGTDYIAQVFEYSGAPGTEKYNTSVATNNPMSQPTLACISPTSGGTIAENQAGCTLLDVAEITSISAASGNSGRLEYKWQQSTVSNSTGFTDIAGSNSITYNPGIITVTTWYKRLARVTCKRDWTGAAESNVVQVTIDAQPIAVAGANQTLCNTSTFAMNAVPTMGTGSWSFVGASGSAVITTSGLATTTITSVPTNQNITLRWTETNGTCSSSGDVVIRNDAQPIAAAGADQVLCNTSSFTMAAVPTVGTGVWSFVGVSESAVISTPGSATTTITSVPFDQNITLRWTETNGTCSSFDDVVIRNDAQPIAAAGADQTLCNTSTFTMSAVPTAGTGAWSFVGESGTAVITTPGLATTTITSVPTNQNIALRWSETNGTCSSFDDVIIRNDAQPTAVAGADQVLCNTATFMMAAVPTVGIGSWSFVDTSGTAVITTPESATTTITSVPSNQDIILRWSETNGTCNSTDDVIIRNNTLPVATAGADRAICLNSSTTIGADPVLGSSYTWTSVPEGFTSTEANPTVSPLETTTYTLTETNAAGCSTTNSIMVTVNPLPTAKAGDDRTICVNSGTTLGEAAVSGSSYSWTSVPVGYTSTEANPLVSPLVNTTYTVVETNSNGCTNTGKVSIKLDPIPEAYVASGTKWAVCLNSSTALGKTAIPGHTYSWTSLPEGYTSTASDPAVSPTINTVYTLVETNASGCSNSNSILLTVNPIPEAYAGADRAICLNNSTTIGAPAIEGHTYSWTSIPEGFTSSQANPTITPSVTTIYKLTEKITATSCINKSSVKVTVNPLPVAIAGSDRTICMNAKTTLGATAVSGSSYSWTSLPEGFTSTEANPSVSPLVTTTYTVVETNVNGCTNTNSVKVTVNQLPEAKAGDDKSICLNTSTTIGAEAVSGSVYNWTSVPAGFSSTEANPIVSPLVTTTYTVVETNVNGCTNSNSVKVTVNQLPEAKTGDDKSICMNTSTTIGAEAVSGNVYKWTSIPAGFTSTEANPTVSSLETTTYTLTETNAAGCTNTNSVKVTVNQLPTATLIGDAQICAGSVNTIGIQLTGKAPWSITVNDGTISQTINNITADSYQLTVVLPDAFAKSYSITSVSDANGCTNSGNGIITVNPLPVAKAGDDRSICANTSTTIGAEAVSGSIYTWTSVPTGFTSTTANPMVSPLVTTTYTLTETNAAGCTNTNTVKVTVNQSPTTAGAISGTNIVNPGQTVTYAVPVIANATSYSWTLPTGASGSSTNNSITVNYGTVVVESSITVKGINACGDGVSSTLEIKVNQAPVANAGAAQTVDEGKLVNLDGTLSSDPEGNTLTYKWVAPEGITLSSTTASRPSFTAPEVKVDTEYAISLTVNDGALNSTSSTVIITVKNVIKTDAEITPVGTLKTYPNPTNGILTIEGMKTDENTNIAVYTIDGRLIMNKTSKLATDKIDLSNQVSGTYILKVNKQVIKILKK